MNKLQELTSEISQLTLQIQEKYPSLHKHLQENPVTIPDGDGDEIRIKHLSDYLKSLKQMLQQYLDNRKED